MLGDVPVRLDLWLRLMLGLLIPAIPVDLLMPDL